MGNCSSSGGYRKIFQVEPDPPEVQMVKFPQADDFAESTCVYQGDLIVPINGRESGLYRYHFDENTKAWIKAEVIFSTPAGKVMMGTKIHEHTIVGCYSNLDKGIFVYHLLTKEYKEIPIKGYANDLCFDDEDPTIVYMCTNVDYKVYNCYLYKINIVTNTFERICAEGPFTAAAGINCLKGKIYVATLDQIWVLEKANPSNFERLQFNTVAQLAFPFFDNIIIDYQQGMILFAVYDAHQCFCYPVLSNPCCLAPSTYLYSYFYGAGYGDIHNTDRKPNYDKVLYIIYNPETKKNAIKEVTFHSTFHDSTVTQVTNYRDDLFILTNWKANFIVIKKLDITYKDDNVFDMD